LLGSAWIIKQNASSFIRGLQLNEALTLSKFTFSDYHTAGADYTGNKLTGIPAQVSVTSLQVLLPQRFNFFIQHNYTSRLPLNDGNTVYASHYNLMQAKASWTWLVTAKTKLEIYAGADNILNQKYSLGNDLNAVGNRYYNAAPLRNYYAGVNLLL
jgi:iron complex outermembrane receptor protein